MGAFEEVAVYMAATSGIPSRSKSATMAFVAKPPTENERGAERKDGFGHPVHWARAEDDREKNTAAWRATWRNRVVWRRRDLTSNRTISRGQA
jgi:hypothetical protein